MLATAWPRVPPGDEWAHEVKWDGVRAIVGGDGAIRSRNGNRIDGSYPELTGAVPREVVVDGEIVALDRQARPSFQALQARMHVARPSPDLVASVPVTLMVFDLLFAGEPIIELPWEERRRRLEETRFAGPVVLSQVTVDGAALLEAVIELDLEGVVSKRRTSTYRPGRRSEDWRKRANRKSCQAVVVGSTPGTGHRSGTFGALALGLWLDDGTMRYVGAVGSGFDDAALAAIDSALDEMALSQPPPMEDPDVVPGPVRWVAPTLVAVVEYAEWTAEGRLRAPVFKGFSATPSDEVTWEAEAGG